MIIPRAVEDEFDAWLGRARYERRPADQREERNEESGMRDGFRPRRLQTAEGQHEFEVPQVRQAPETFASTLFPRTPKLSCTGVFAARLAAGDPLLGAARVAMSAASLSVSQLGARSAMPRADQITAATADAAQNADMSHE